MTGGGSGRGKGDEARVQVAFHVPLEFAFRWCTDYTPEDAALEGESYSRKIVERSGRRVVFGTSRRPRRAGSGPATS